jgi:signal transduction histidine kinase
VGTHATDHTVAFGGGTIREVTSQRLRWRVGGERRARAHFIARVLATMLAYYAGARIGFLLQPPSVPQSVLWLPNSILLAVLIVSPPRSWFYLLAPTLGAQLLVGHQTHAPPLAMTLLFITNCLDAMLGATLWRIGSSGLRRVQSLRGMVIFLVFCATLPTLLLSFADAALTVATHWSNDFWLVYQTRARANVLTNMIFVPTALALWNGEWSDIVKQWRSRWIEGSCMLSGLLATSFLAFTTQPGTASNRALSYLPLAFVVWCAVRFGIAMTGASMLTLTYIATWTVMRGVGPSSQDHSEIVPALQFALLAIAIPVLCLAAVVQDRERASRALGDSQTALRHSLARIRMLAGRLLWATERERSRIALELHDDLGQQLAALGIGLSALKRHLPNDPQLRDEVTTLHTQAMNVAEAVRVLSHELHPAALRFGRLVPAMHQLCAQFGSGGSMRAIFAAQPDEVSVADDVALCVFRVTQEALGNAARHSGAREAYVTLRARNRAVELQIEDDGVGFEDGSARSSAGLGLTSMVERARLVGGTVSVESSPGSGTRISLHIPTRGSHGAADSTARG